MKTLILSIICLGIYTSAVAADRGAATRDGRWWNQQSQDTKIFYVVGLRDGLGVGEVLVPNGDAKREYRTMVGRLMVRSELAKLCTELETFYRNRENAQIPVFKALVVAAMILDGADQKTLRELVAVMRHESA